MMVLRRVAILLWAVATYLLFPEPALAKELVVSQDGAPLLAECSESSPTLAALAQGQTVRLRFALAGSSSRCYSVSAELDGRQVSGYVAKEALGGLEEFEQSRRDAAGSQVVDSVIQTIGLPANTSTPDVSRPADTPAQQAMLMRAAAELKDANPGEAERILASAGLPRDHPTAALLRAKSLLQLSRPSAARSALQSALRSHANDPNLLAMAGMISYQLDDMRAAEAYLKRALSIHPDPSVSRVYDRVQRELKGDKSDDKTYGSRFILRYEGEAFPHEVARNLKSAFEAEINRVTFQLGCPQTERLIVVVQTRENYRNTTGAADWSGGRYDGKIRIVLPPSGEVDAYVRRTFSHEFVHACLAKIHPWPAWLHEGLAQKLSGDRLDAVSRQMLQGLARENRLPQLKGLGGSWAHLNSVQARVAYNLALAAMELYDQQFRAFGLRNLMRNPGRLPEITAELDRRLPDYLR